MSFEQTRWVWLNGHCLPWQQATVHVSAHALHYGSGVFEGLRCYETAEGAGENLFLVRNHTLKTNDAGHSILLGITRDAVIEIARDLGYAVEIGALTLEELFEADEAFFTGTAAEITPIREVDERPIGNGGRGKVTATIQQVFGRAVRGQEEGYRSWLHPVAQPVKAVM